MGAGTAMSFNAALSGLQEEAISREMKREKRRGQELSLMLEASIITAPSVH